MRLRDIQTIINESAANLMVGNVQIPKDNQNRKINNLNAFKEAFKKVEKMGIYQSDIENLMETEAIFLTHNDSISLPNGEANNFQNLLKQLQNKLFTFNIGISSIIPEQDENSISIKLPPINDLKELIDISKSLDTIFNQILVTKNNQTEAKIQNFDTGSKWIEITFTSVIGLTIFSQLIQTAILLEREQLKNKHIEEIIRREKTITDGYENILSNLNEQLKHDLDDIKNNSVDEIVKKANINLEEEPEYPARVKNSIDSIIKLIAKGMKFFPSAKATEVNKEILPDFTKELKDMLPETKQLENK